MIEISKDAIAERFMRYVQIDTQSDPQSNSHPSTEKQKKLSLLLAKELKKLGVEILWFMPITPIGIEGRKANEKELGSYYAVRDYKAVNPEFGTMADWKHLVKLAHSMGFKVITDWVPNHSSPDNHWIKDHPDFYKKDSAGNFTFRDDWSDTSTLNYENAELRDSMIDAMKWWIKQSDIDGFRCDVATGPSLDVWKTGIDYLNKRKHVFMVAEVENPERNACDLN